jgi:hypothetical protein
MYPGSSALCLISGLVRYMFILLMVIIMVIRLLFVVHGVMMRPFVHEGERLDTSVGKLEYNPIHRA